VVHALFARSVLAARLISLACATVSFVLILRAERLGNLRFTAAALLAVYPPAVLMAVDARAYAMAAMFVTMAILWSAAAEPPLWKAALALVAAAYAHYYAVLLFPLAVKWRRNVLLLALFLPGFLLALHQPREATGWLTTTHFDALRNLSFAGFYAEALFKPAPIALVIVALIVLAAAVARSFRFAPAVLIPIAGAIVFGLAGRPIYFPMRFESVIAPPLVLWAASSLDRWQPKVRRMLAAALLLIGVVVTWMGIVDHLRRPLDPTRSAALYVSRLQGMPIVASGYAWLEVASATGREPIAFPPQQAEHPGWRHRLTLAEARAAAKALPSGPFLFVGEASTPELAAIRELRPARPIFIDRGIVVLNVR